MARTRARVTYSNVPPEKVAQFRDLFDLFRISRTGGNGIFVYRRAQQKVLMEFAVDDSSALDKVVSYADSVRADLRVVPDQDRIYIPTSDERNVSTRGDIIQLEDPPRARSAVSYANPNDVSTEFSAWTVRGNTIVEAEPSEPDAFDGTASVELVGTFRDDALDLDVSAPNGLEQRLWFKAQQADQQVRFVFFNGDTEVLNEVYTVPRKWTEIKHNSASAVSRVRLQLNANIVLTFYNRLIRTP